MSTAADWREYDRWNDVIADVVFPITSAPAPVYLDLEDDVLAAIASRLGLTSDQVVAGLSAVVSRTSDLDSNHAFSLHRGRTAQWLTRPQTSAPPILPLLSLFSLAAERMAGGSGMSATNYYGRLAEIVGGQPSALGNSYRAVAEFLWGSLNSWLSLQGGGSGTADCILRRDAIRRAGSFSGIGSRSGSSPA